MPNQNLPNADSQSLLNHSIGENTNIGDIQGEGRSNYGGAIERALIKKGKDYDPFVAQKQKKRSATEKYNRDDIAIHGEKTLPQPGDIDRPIPIRSRIDRPNKLIKIPNRSYKGCCHCLKKKKPKPIEHDNDIVEVIEIELDTCMKNAYVFAYTLQALNCIYITCILFYSFYY